MVNTEEINKIKATLIGQRAVHEKEVAEAHSAVTQMKAIIDSITDEDVAAMRESGLDIEFIKNIDTDRLEQDDDYLANCKHRLENECEELYNKLKETINV